MLVRGSLLLVALVLVAASLLFLREPRTRGVVRANAAAEPTSVARQEPSELDEPATGPAPAPTAHREAASAEPREAVRIEGVLVRVQVQSGEGDTPWLKGALVELQSWDEDLDEVTLHEATLDAAGRTSFAFPGETHVDWVRVLPPEMTGLAMAFVEEHENLYPGDVHEVQLTLQRGGRISGQVIDLDGRPAGGARVHIFDGEVGNNLTQWQPGLVSVTSDPAGRFQTPLLPRGIWGLMVEPGDWLPFAPKAGDSVRGQNMHPLEVGSEITDALLTVVRAHPFEVCVVDARGDPVPGASVQLEPLQLLGGGLLVAAREENRRLDPLEVFLGEHAPRKESNPATPTWPYGELYWSTNAHGRARAVGVAGTWRMTVSAPSDDDPERGDAVTRLLELPAGDLTVALTTEFRSYRGRVVDEAGRPLSGAWANLRPRGVRNAIGATSSDDQGHFQFDWMHPGRSYDLRVTHPNHLALVRSIEGTRPDDPPDDTTMRASSRLNLKLTDPFGEPLARANLYLREVRPAGTAREEEREGIESLMRGRPLRTNRAGRLSLRGLPPGDIVLELQRSFAIAVDADGWPQVDVAGSPRVEQRPVHSWTLNVAPQEQTLVIDVSAWPEPQARPMPLHAGIVRNATTGAPIEGAEVYALSEKSYRTARTDADGTFQLRGLPDAYGLMVLAAGYQALRGGTRAWPGTRQEHTFVLLPGAEALAIEFQDRDGVRLPTVDVTVRDASDAVVRLATRSPGRSAVWRQPARARDGSLTAIALPEGWLRFQLLLRGVGPLGECRARIAAGAMPARLELRLGRTLEEIRADYRARRDAAQLED